MHHESIILVPLSKGKFATIDEADAELILPHKWYAHSAGYACRDAGGRPPKRRCLLMHRVIMGAGPGEEVDHVSGDRLDNRRSNLRFASRVENQANRPVRRDNRTGFKGVHLRDYGRYAAKIKKGGELTMLGMFDTAEEAARAYDAAALEFFGDFAWLNFPMHDD